MAVFLGCAIGESVRFMWVTKTSSVTLVDKLSSTEFRAFGDDGCIPIVMGWSAGPAPVRTTSFNLDFRLWILSMERVLCEVEGECCFRFRETIAERVARGARYEMCIGEYAMALSYYEKVLEKEGRFRIVASEDDVQSCLRQVRREMVVSQLIIETFGQKCSDRNPKTGKRTGCAVPVEYAGDAVAILDATADSLVRTTLLMYLSDVMKGGQIRVETYYAAYHRKRMEGGESLAVEYGYEDYCSW